MAETKSTAQQKQTLRAMVWQLRKARQITAGAALVLHALAGKITAQGAFPSHETLAAEVGLSRSTVIRALQAAKELGVIVWQRRTALHGRLIVRTSNLYSFLHGQAAKAKEAALAMVEQAKEAANRRRAEYLRRMADFRQLELSVILEPKAQTSFIRKGKDYGYPQPQRPILTREEMIAFCMANAEGAH